MFSVAPNIVLAPNMTQNAERKHRTQDTNTAPIRPHSTQEIERKHVPVNHIWAKLHYVNKESNI